MRKTAAEMIDVKWKLIKPVRTGHSVIVPASWKCTCDKSSDDYTGKYGCLCYLGHEICPFYSPEKSKIGKHIVKVHNESLSHD